MSDGNDIQDRLGDLPKPSDLPGLAQDAATYILDRARWDETLALAIAREAFLMLGGRVPPVDTGLEQTPAQKIMGQSQGTPMRGRYKVRVMLTRGDSVEADTDPELAPDARPTIEVTGMSAIIELLRDVATPFHVSRQEPEPALDIPALERRLSALRVSLSRSGGNTWWHVKYTVGTAEWAAAVHVVRG